MDGVLRRLTQWFHRVREALRGVGPLRLLRRLAARAESRRANPKEDCQAFDVDAESEFNMADLNPKDLPQDNQPSAADNDDSLDVTLASMQSELQGLTDMITGEDATDADTFDTADAATKPDEVVAAFDGEAEALAEADATADDAESQESEELTAEAVEMPDAISDESDPTAEVGESAAVSSDEVKESVPDAAQRRNESAEAEHVGMDADVDAVLADVAAERDTAPPAATTDDVADVTPVSSKSAKEGGGDAVSPLPSAQPDGTASGISSADWAEGMSVDSVREASAPFTAGRHSPRGQRRPERTVESAIQNLAAFLQGEVNGAWNDARGALEEILTYRDEMRRTAQRVSALHRELLAMRDDVVSARREARGIQTQMQNLRDDAARARQRADAAALDAQSAADRAVAAAREAESAINITREM